MNRELFLPTWVHACHTPDGLIFLDVRNDVYFGLDASQVAALEAAPPGSADSSATVDSIVNDLLERGLLTRDTGQSKPFRPTMRATPDTLLVSQSGFGRPNLRTTHVVRFLLSLLTMWILLRWGSLERALGRLERANPRLTRRHDPWQLEEASELLRAFVYLRPIFYAARDNCLFDSLTLADYMHRFAIPATCVFGVKTLPFEAHCWVQIDRYLIHDQTPEAISTFSPILYV